MKKFPRTPHIKGSKGTPDDIFESKYLYEGLVIATEKNGWNKFNTRKR